MQTTRPRITWKVLPMLRLPFKEIPDHAKRFRLWIVLFWTKTSQRLTLYLLSSHRYYLYIVLENDNTVLIKNILSILNVKIKNNLENVPILILKSREITFQQYRENLASRSFPMVINIHEHKRYYYTFDNSLLFIESIQNTTQIFPR